MHYPEFEQAILSSLLFENRLIEQTMSLGLRAGHFTHPFREELYALLLSMHSEGVDEQIVKQKFGSSLDESEFIAIISSNPISNLDYYVNQIIEAASLREARQVALEIIEDTSKNTSFEKVLVTLNSSLERLQQRSGSFLQMYGMNEIDAQEAEFLCKSWLPFPKKAVSLISAGGGVGKSFLMMQAAMRMVIEDNVKVFMWLSEDPLSLSKYRFDLIANEILKKDTSTFSETLKISGSDSETVHFMEEDRAGLHVSASFYQFKKLLSAFDVIILDPLIALFGGDENSNTQARQFINLFTRWATQEDKTIIFIHHSTKNSSQSRGASAFVDAVRLVYQVDLVKNKEGKQIEKENRQIYLAKDNNGAKKHLDSFEFKRQIFPRTKEEVILEIDLL